MPETVFHDETVFAEEKERELSPIEQLKMQWGHMPGSLPLLKQANLIERNPGLLPYAGMAALPGWSWPYAFALQALLVAAALASAFNWYATRDSGPRHEEIIRTQVATETEMKRLQGIMDATEAEIRRISNSPRQSFNLHMSPNTITREQALQELNASLEDSRKSADQFKQRMQQKEADLRAAENASAIANSGTPLLFTLALVLAVGGVSRGVQKEFSRSRFARNAGDFYLYLASAEGLLLNLVFLVFLHLGLSGGNYGLGGLFESVGPLVWVFYWIGFYALLLRYFVSVSRGMYQALGLRQPLAEWGPANRILLRIHNSFLVMFAFLEGAFLIACYLFYHVGKRLL